MEASDVVQAFLTRYFADEDDGHPRSLEDYRAEFPGYDEVIARAYEAVREQGAFEDAEARVAPVDGGTIGPFRVLREIGRGGQGTVVLAEDTRLGRHVALKLLGGLGGLPSENALRRFRREAELAARLTHPAICPILEAGVQDGVPYLVMPYLAGRSLAALLKSEGALSEARALLLFEVLASALQAAHDRGVVHRDLKPANILLVGADQPVLMDFGVARDAEDESLSLTATGELVGTLPYIAPEQVEGSPADAQSDVYSLGVTLYEAVTGRPPFDGPTRRALMHAITTQDPLPAHERDPRISRDLSIVLAAALEKDRSRRLLSAAELGAELRRIRERRPIRSRPAGLVLVFRRWLQRNPRVAAGVLTSFAALAIGLVVALALLRRVDEERQEKIAALDEIEQLADLTRLRSLVARIADLEPARGAELAAIDAWLSEADRLLAKRAAHEESLRALRARASVLTEPTLAALRTAHPDAAEIERLDATLAFLDAEIARLGDAPEGESERELVRRDRLNVSARREELAQRLSTFEEWRFERAEDQWRHDRADELLSELRAFAAADAFAPTRAKVERLRAFAVDLQRKTLEAPREDWERTCRAVADRERFPHYRGLQLVPIEGLVPLGADPRSQLFEFADPRSGEPPSRDTASGALQLEEDSAAVFVLLPGGRARIGAQRPDASHALGTEHVDPHATRFEAPVHDVELDPFLISKYEVTQGQWLRLAGKNPSVAPIGTRYRDQPPVTALHPVDSLSWSHAGAVLRTAGWHFPTSVQWEYAARGGSTRVFAHDDDDPESLENLANLADRALARASNGDERQHALDDGWAGHAPIGSFPPNGFGLHEVMGNMHEWCRDVRHEYRSPAAPGDGLRWVGDASLRVLRGGSYLLPFSNARSAATDYARLENNHYPHGVRPIFLWRAPRRTGP